MKTSFCMNVFPPEQIEEALGRIARLGYEGVEFWDQYLSHADIPCLKHWLATHRIAVSQLCPYFSFVGTQAEWDNSMRIAERYVGLARELDAHLIRVFTGKGGSADVTPAQWRAAVAGLRAICDMGRADRIVFALETHAGSLMDTSASTRRLIEEVGRDNLKVNLQAPLKGEPDPLFSARQLGRYTVHLHAHNWKVRGGYRDIV